MNEKTQENIKTEDSKLLYEKLAEGISSMKSGEIYTILSKKPGRKLTNYNEINPNPYHNPSDTFIHCKKVS